MGPFAAILLIPIARDFSNAQAFSDFTKLTGRVHVPSPPGQSVFGSLATGSAGTGWVRNRFAPLENDVSSSRRNCKIRALLYVRVSKHNPASARLVDSRILQIAGRGSKRDGEVVVAHVSTQCMDQTVVCPANGLAAVEAPGRHLTRLMARGVTSGPGLDRACVGRRKAHRADFGGD